MLCLKKVYTDELLQLAILLSLLRTEQNSDLIQVPALAGIGSDESWQMGRPYISRDTRVHPKSIDAMLINDHQDLFNDLNSLGRYSPSRWRQQVTAYVGLTNGPRTDQRNADDDPLTVMANHIRSMTENNETTAGELPSTSDNRSTSPVEIKVEIKKEIIDDDSDSSLTEEDMELIEVLWKQDVDMGFTIADWQENSTLAQNDGESSSTAASPSPADLFDQAESHSEKKIKSPLLSEVKGDTKLSDIKEEEKPDLWAGKSYTIDLETGEFIEKDERSDSAGEEDETPSSLLPTSDFSLEEALDLVGLNDGFEDFLERVAGGDDHDDGELAENDDSPVGGDDDVESVDKSSSESERSREEAADLASELDDMIQTPTYHHHRAYQGRVGYSRAVSMEQRWQDLASLLSLPEHQQGYPPHHPLHPHHPLGYHQAAAAAAAASSVDHHHPHTHHPHPGAPPPPPHHHHHHHLSHPHHHHPAAHHPAAKAPGTTGGVTSAPSTPLAASAAEYGSPLGPNNVGSAVASSMNLMTNSSEPMGGEGGAVTNFKMENPHEMMYYQQNNATSEMNPSTEGFLSSILNDEDLQLMDMAMNEGMYTMRMLEGASGAGSGTAAGGGATGGGGGSGGGGDSDSAVSSMGSERVPSLASDTEWMETNSDSGHTSADHYSSEYAASAFSKYKWYDYGYSRHIGAEGGRGSNGGSSGGGGPVAQKKHHMYGKRVFHDPPIPHGLGVAGGGGACSGGAVGPIKMELGASSAASGLPIHGGSPYAGATASPSLDARLPGQSELKYSCSVEFSRTFQHQTRPTPAQLAAHNHTYHLLAEDCTPQQRPLTRDKKSSSRKSEEETHLTRDERRARSLSIPLAVDDIINLPMDEFNERLSKYDLSENQLSLIRDIRRRGKNKVAAQNCRKRKLDQILCLADEVKQMKDRKQRLLHERQVLLSERHRIKNKYSQLYRHIFQSLRDVEGNPYSPHEWSLQQTADGSVILVPRGNQTMLGQSEAMAASSRKDHHHPRNNSSSNA